MYRVRRNKYEVVVKTATFERHEELTKDFFACGHLCRFLDSPISCNPFVALLKMEVDIMFNSLQCAVCYIYIIYNISKAVHPNFYIMTPPPCTRNKNLNWKDHDDDDDIDELQAATILTCLDESTTPSTTSTSYDIDTTTTDDDTTITVFHPVSPTSSITSSSPVMSSISTTTNTKKHDCNIITPTLTSSPSPTELIEVARPAKKRRHEVDSHSRRSTTAKPCVFPTTNDPEDMSFEKTLHSDDDEGKINIAHVHIRREVLEVKRSMSGRVYFQCKLHVIMCSYCMYISCVHIICIICISSSPPSSYTNTQADGVSILIARTVLRAQSLLQKTYLPCLW